MHLATLFLFVRVLGKQSISQEGLGIGRQKFKGILRVMGWKRQQAGGHLVGKGLLLSPAVLSMSFLATGQSQVRRPPIRKQREWREGVQLQAVDQRSLEKGRSLRTRGCTCVFCDGAQCRPLPLPSSHTHTHGGQRDQTSLLASDIFICSEQSLPREGDPRDAPEQILTSSIRSL